MYSTFFGLRTNPFLPLSDPEMILRSTQVRETLQHFLYARQNHHGIFLLTGEVGTGKTTAIQAAVAELPAETPVIFLPPTLSSWGELRDELCLALSLRGAKESNAEKRRRLESCLAMHAAEGNRAVVVVDEAHLLPDTVLDHLRLLTNIRDGRHPVVQICLVGQPELVMRLRSDQLRQLRQRITLRYTMMPLSLGETELYLIERLRGAGARNSDTIFDAGAVRAIYAMTGGIPREINVVADQAMTNAFVNNVSFVSRRHLRSVQSEFGFEGVFIDPGQSKTLTFLQRDSLRELRPVPRHESPPEPMPIVDAATTGRAPAHATMESSSPLEPQLAPPPESTLLFEEAPSLQKVLDASVRFFHRSARRFRLVPAAATLFVLGFAVVGVMDLFSGSELPRESARTTAPIAPTTPAAVVKTAYLETADGRPSGVSSPTPPEAIELSAKADEATREPRKVDDRKTDPAIDDEIPAVVPAVAPVTQPASPSGVEERYPSTLEVQSGAPVVVWLGEERLGTAPGSFSPVPPGRYHVKLELADGRFFSKDVIVTPGSTTYVRANWSDP
jgi:type II secretory pathway predicted ATPase ExeA